MNKGVPLGKQLLTVIISSALSEGEGMARSQAQLGIIMGMRPSLFCQSPFLVKRFRNSDTEGIQQ